MNIAVLMTCHNRRDKTLSCLRSLHDASLPKHWVLHVILVDDGSSDNTSDSVSLEFPSVEILKGNGNLFWNRGMYMAFDHALKSGFDAYIWLNDDTVLQVDALENIDHAYRELSANFNSNIIVVGSTKDLEGRLSYGGSISVSRLMPFKYTKVWNAERPIECHVMNGNCVFIPSCIAKKVGNLDPAFEHAMGDTDYALRARACGGRIFVAPGYVGECANNSINNTFVDSNLSVIDRWRLIVSRKGLPPASWCRFTRRHGGFVWPIYFSWPYFKIFFR